MKTLVVYYSRKGSSKQVAEDLAVRLNADITRINIAGQKEKINVVHAFFNALSNKTRKLEGDINPGKYEYIVLVTPIWIRRPVLAITSYLVTYRNLIKNYAVVTVSGARLKNPAKEFTFILGRDPKIAKSIKRKEVKENTYDLSEFN